MKKLSALTLAFLFCRTLPAELVLKIDTKAGTLDWGNGTSIRRLAVVQLDNNVFGTSADANPDIDAEIFSPLLKYSGAGRFTSVRIFVSPDRATVQGITLLTTSPPGVGAVFSGTPEGPINPAFARGGGFSSLAGLEAGDYLLEPQGPWNGGIRVVVLPFALNCRFSPAEGRIDLSWPTNTTGYVLESSDSISAGSWIAVTNVPAVAGPEFQVSVDPAGQHLFFRLNKP